MGNNREVWRAAYVRAASTNIAAATIQQTQYYPSGLPWSEGMGASAQSRKFNGKEFVEMHGLDTYDYGARGYYPAMGRFMTVDPLAEMDYSVSPYTYCKGNPINMIDPNGMTAESSIHVNYLPLYCTSTFVDTNNKIIEHRDDGDPTVYEVENEKDWRDKGSSKIGLERGKEFIEMSGLDTYDYGARGYYPASGSFMTVDPLAEKDYSVSPYVYCHNNPVNRIDPDGRNDKNGKKTEINPTNGVPTSAQSTTAGNESIEKIKPTPLKNQKSSGETTVKTNKKADASVTAKTHHEVNTPIASIDVYGTNKVHEGTSNIEVTVNAQSGLKETEASSTLGVIKATTNTDGSGGSLGVGAVALGGKVGNLVTLDISQQIPFTTLGIGVTITFNPANLIVVPVRVLLPETNLIPIPIVP